MLRTVSIHSFLTIRDMSSSSSATPMRWQIPTASQRKAASTSMPSRVPRGTPAVAPSTRTTQAGITWTRSAGKTRLTKPSLKALKRATSSTRAINCPKGWSARVACCRWSTVSCVGYKLVFAFCLFFACQTCWHALLDACIPDMYHGARSLMVLRRTCTVLNIFTRSLSPQALVSFFQCRTPNGTDTGNACKHPGYDEFEPASWPSKCAPQKEDWIVLNRYICGEDGSYPEEFWACSDIAITSGEGSVQKAQKYSRRYFCCILFTT